ncbi:MAG: PKD domain-containing protein, partial [Bacteroidota bacterium]
VTLIVTSDMGCTNSVSHTISFWPIPLANFSNTAGCANAGIQFTDFSVVSGGNINSWNWDFGNGLNAAIQNPTTQYSAGGNYNVTLVIQSDHGCRDTLVKPISIYPGPNADFSMSGDLTTGGVVEFTNLSSSGTSYNWNFGDGIGTSTIMSPLYTYLNEGTYLVTMIVTDANYCTDTATTNISIRQNIEVELYPPKVPTGFTPNGDGQNDVLFVRGGPFRYVEFKVFNAWGQEIFSTNDATIGWDGTWKDVDQPMAVYTYTVKATTEDEKTYTKSGNVTLIR